MYKRQGHNLRVKVLHSTDVIELLDELGDVTPQRGAARGIIGHGAQILLAEHERHIIGNLVTHPDGLVALENLSLGVRQGEQGVDVLQHSGVPVDIVENKLASLDGRLQLRLGVISVDGQLTIILEIGEGLIDRTASLSTGHPVHQGICLLYTSSAIMRITSAAVLLV